jgi:hypothetical protein
MIETILDTVTGRIGRLDWDDLQRRLDEQGVAITEGALKGESVELADLFESDRFRSTIGMALGVIFRDAR